MSWDGVEFLCRGLASYQTGPSMRLVTTGVVARLVVGYPIFSELEDFLGFDGLKKWKH